MAVGIVNPHPSPAPLDSSLWSVKKHARRLRAVTRIYPNVDGVELRYDVDGEFLQSRRYAGAALAELKPDADAKLVELLAKGWIVE